MTPSTGRNRSSSSNPRDDDVKSGFLYPTIPAHLAGYVSKDAPSACNMDPGAVKALVSLKENLKKVFEDEQNRLRTSRHDAFEPIADLAQRLDEEKDKLKHVLRKATEKQGTYERAMKEYDNSRAVVASAREEGGPHDNEDLNVRRKPY